MRCIAGIFCLLGATAVACWVPWSAPGSTAEDVWLADEVMVLPSAGVDLDTIVRRHGTEVAVPVGRSGWGALAVPGGVDRHDVISALTEDAHVQQALPEGRTRGLGEGIGYDPGAYQWHLLAARALDPPTTGLDAVVVAVLDTGVAWRNHEQNGERYVVAPSLGGIRFVAPHDFINHDDSPDDDHQHGTHITSLIASRGTVHGVAPGVSIMPLKVLDSDDVGTELALVEGIHWAVDHGAHIINMSLSFSTGYVPSEALVSAIERAANAGVVLVGAAGNDGGEVVTQPAANPQVIAVGAVRPGEDGGYVPAAYANASPRVDLVAPGGSVEADRDGDGFLDGLLAETIALHDPTRVGYWLYAGTSQAAALVSGAAAWLVKEGHTGDEVRVLLQAGARTDTLAAHPFLDGYGRGLLDADASRTLARAGASPTPRDYFVSLLAWLEPGERGAVRPAALLTVLDDVGRPATGIQLAGLLAGAGGSPFACTPVEGTCRIVGNWRVPAEGEAWVISVDAVMIGGVAFRPGTAMFANPGLQELARTLRGDLKLSGSVLSFHWSAHHDDVLGAVAASDLLLNLGVGRATSPTAVVLTPGVISQSSVLGVGGVYGAGDFADRWRLLRLPTPSGGVHLFSIDADTLSGTPVALSARALLSGGTPGYHPVLVGTGHFPGPLARNRALGQELAGTPLGDLLGAGGWITPNGEPGASAVAGSGAAAIRPAPGDRAQFR